ncbi:MAG: YidH family protein [Bacteroidota bacterium]|jgi:putative membrane protein
MAFLTDPRVLFAAERTLLAWVRTAIALIGLGFVVAKFGLYLHLIAGHEPSPRHELLALAIGVAMVLAGVVTCVLAAAQFRRILAELGPGEIPSGYRTGVPGVAAYALAALGVLVAAYLVTS